MRAAFPLVLVVAMLLLLACGGETGAPPDATTAPVAPTMAAAPVVSPMITPTPTLTATPFPTPTPTSTPVPKAPPSPTSSPAPTATPQPTPTSTPTSSPIPSPTSRPTATLAPTATPMPSPPPTHTPVPDVRASYGGGQTGLNVEGMEIFDELIPALLEKWDIPGGAIAVAKDGRLALAKGYGLSDIEDNEPVLPDSLFRIASISKPFTAVAILQLVEQGELGLDDRVFEILDNYQAPEGTTRDPRINEVTVRQLLQHSGGWDRDKSFDAMWIAGRVERELATPKPVSCEDVITFMLGQPLDFDPGTQYAYSNFGYCLLGRIIEKISQQPYEEYVRSRITEPANINRMRIGGTLLQDRAEGEVRYYPYPEQPLAYSVLPGTPQRVPWPYGGFYLAGRDSSGGWIASPVDLVRFAMSLDGSRPPLLLEPETVGLMVSPPSPRLRSGLPYYYGMGWSVRPVKTDATWWHDGSQPGTMSLMVRTYHGLIWAALFNSRPMDHTQFERELDDLFWEGVRGVTSWPSHDLFPYFGYE